MKFLIGFILLAAAAAQTPPPRKVYISVDMEGISGVANDALVSAAGSEYERGRKVGTQQALETRVTRANAPRVLEYNDTRWELEASGGGTRLTLWHNIDRRFISWGAAGWHISFDVLERLLSGTPIGRIAGGEAMKFGWQRLNAEYAKQFGIEMPNWPPQAAQKS